MPSDQAWQRLGELLIRRRLDLDPRYRNRQVFADERGAEYRIVSDIERARRTNFHAVTIAEIERAYGLPSGAIGRFLAGGELERGGTVRREAAAPTLRAAAPPDLLPTTTAMEAAIRVHMQEVNDRLEFVRRRFPGQRLTGVMMFPTAPRDQRVWDGLVADGETEEATAQGIAAMRAWRQEKAAAQENGTVTAIRRA